MTTSSITVAYKNETLMAFKSYDHKHIVITQMIARAIKTCGSSRYRLFRPAGRKSDIPSKGQHEGA